jgi:hypothetical protein
MALVDGKYFLNHNGPISGDPVRMDLLLASDSIGALDRTICLLMGLDIYRVRYLDLACQLGRVPEFGEIEYNKSLDSFRTHDFHLKLTLRNRVVRWAFNYPWAISLFWNSWFGDQFHKALYAIAGNPLQDDINRVSKKIDSLRD